MDKLKIGNTYTEKVKFTQENVNKFAEITGDNNPIHINEEYAAKAGSLVYVFLDEVQMVSDSTGRQQAVMLSANISRR